MVIRNPYDHIVGIDDDELFFNRVEDKERILNALFSGLSQCISIVGQRKIGKTSLIQSLSRPTTLASLGFADLDVLFVYVNCQMYQYAQKDVNAFYQFLVKHLYKEIKQNMRQLSEELTLNKSENNGGQEEWGRLLEELTDRGIYVATILDEFDEVISQGQLIKDGLFGSLCSYGYYPKFSWITCTYRPLHVLLNEAFDAFQIPENIRLAESDFFNIFAGDHVVSLFTAEDIDELIKVPARRCDTPFSEKDIQHILRFGGRFPYFIQRACHHTFYAKLHNTVNHKVILEKCVREAQTLWNQYWNNLHTHQQEILLALASVHGFGDADQTELEWLRDNALIYYENGTWYPFSEEFTRFILSKEQPHTKTDMQVGDMWKGQYQILQIVGHTEHSQVVKAWDTALQQYVAIKRVYSDRRLSTKTSLELDNRLIREGRIINDVIKDISHKHIGKVYAAITNPKAIIMQWIDGLSLEQLLNGDAPLQIEQVLTIGIDIASALVHIHRQGVIHRDIKPNNIILSKDEGAILIDFDIARSINEETITLGENGTYAYVGNPQYSAPEQFIAPENVGSHTDLFSLGVLLYQLLTRTLPFSSTANPDHYKGRLPRPKQRDIPTPFYTLLCSMMEQNPTHRPTVEQAQAQLQECLDSIQKGS